MSYEPEASRGETEPDLSTIIAGVRFANPVIAASGTFGYGDEYGRLFDISRLGGICTKGLTVEARQGNPGIRLHETPAGLMNSIGLENPGITAFIRDELPRMRKLGPAIIANLSGSTVEDYAEGCALLSGPEAEACRADDGRTGVDMIELNVSCPNVKAGGMAFGLCAADAVSVVRAARSRSAKPLIVKLSPNAGDLVGIALACQEAGADALSLVNTFKALAIDTRSGAPVFRNVFAGLSGPAIMPIALRMVWEVAEAVSIPVMGMGGIASADDALQFIMAGAAAVQVGTATFARPPIMLEIVEGIADRLRGNRSVGIASMIGIARRAL